MEYETTKILLVLLCIGMVFGYPSEHQMQIHTSMKVQYCGTQLANTISLVCKGYYNSLIPSRTTSRPFLSPQDAKAMLRRRRRGVTAECCLKACTYDELRTFCAS